MAQLKFVREMEKILVKYGLYTGRANGHVPIFRRGKRVGTMSAAPGRPEEAKENVIKQLIANGALPPDAIEEVKK